MRTRQVAAEYRLAQWSAALVERTAKGESIQEFCQNRGVSRNTYFYWQRKLREVACRELMSAQQDTERAVVPRGWAICEAAPVGDEAEKAITIEIGKSRITATADTDMELLTKVCRSLMSIC